MKKVSLLMIGLCCAFIGLQSFVNDGDQPTEKTELVSVDENWTINEKATAQALDWRIASCVTAQGLPGTVCKLMAPGTPSCSGPKNKLCQANL